MVLLKYGEAGLSSLTIAGGAYDQGVVFEIANSGFVVPVTFAGTPGQANCYGQSFLRLAQQYGGRPRRWAIPARRRYRTPCCRFARAKVGLDDERQS